MTAYRPRLRHGFMQLQEHPKLGGVRGKKGGRESILKLSSWQALIFHHSN